MKKLISFMVLICAVMAWSSAMAVPYADPTNECEVDADCPALFRCETAQAPDCPSAMTCPVCDCEPCSGDSDEGCNCVCPVCDVIEYSADCGAEVEYKVCAWNPAKCDADADCPSGFECVAEESCSGGGGCVCQPCTCAESYDGGEWFNCECPETYSCDCSDIEEPVCEVTGRYCLPKEVPCETDSDCSEDFSCVATGGTGACQCSDCACPVCPADADCEPCECQPCECDTTESTEKYCLPAGWADYIHDGEVPFFVDSGVTDTDSGVVRNSDSGEPATPGSESIDDAANSTTSCQAGTSTALPGVMVVFLLALGFVLRRRVF